MQWHNSSDLDSYAFTHNHSYLVVRKYEERASACRMGHHCHKLRVDGAEHLRITIFRYPNRLEKLVLLERLPKYISELAFSHKSTRHFTLILQSLHQKPFLWLFELAASALGVCEQMGVVFTLKKCVQKKIITGSSLVFKTTFHFLFRDATLSKLWQQRKNTEVVCTFVRFVRVT